MALLATTHPTLTDVTSRLDPKGQIDTVAEILNQQYPVLDDMVFIEGNLETGHRSTVRTGLPTPTWRKLYGGVQPTKSTTAQITDTIGMLEAYAEVDKALADLNGNTAAFRMSEDRPHIEGIGQELVQTLFTGNETTEPEAFTGFGPRFNSVSGANNSENVLQDVAGSGTAYQSIYLVVWGPNTVHGIYPKGSMAGMQVEDKGQVTIENAAEYQGSGAHQGGRFEAYRTHYCFKAGLCVRDWRYVARLQVAYDDITSAGAGTSGDADLNDYMLQMIDLIPSLSAGRPAFYMSRGMVTKLRQQSVTKTASSTLTWDGLDGKAGKQLVFAGVPVKRVDQLATTETVLS